MVLDWTLLQGMAIGFSVAAPVGPIGVLCIQRVLSSGRLSGLATGLGAASADSLFGAIAAFGITALADLLLGQRAILGLIGGAFLVFLGIRTFRSEPRMGGQGPSRSLIQDYATTFALTITNPMTILSFMAVYAAIGIAPGIGYGNAILFVLGVFLGSTLWWLVLTAGIGMVRGAMDARRLGMINKGAGTLMVALGLYVSVSPLLAS